MLIDWFTVGAQVLNFLILVWLLKRFLYKPILNAIDTREKRIAAELADANAKKSEAQKERDDFLAKNKAFDEQRAALLAKAQEDAKAERERLIGEGPEGRRGPQGRTGKFDPERAKDAWQRDHAHGDDGGVCDREEGPRRPCHGKPGGAHRRGVHAPAARPGGQGAPDPSATRSGRRPTRQSCAARSSCRKRSRTRSRTR